MSARETAKDSSLAATPSAGAQETALLPGPFMGMAPPLNEGQCNSRSEQLAGSRVWSAQPVSHALCSGSSRTDQPCVRRAKGKGKKDER